VICDKPYKNEVTHAFKLISLTWGLTYVRCAAQAQTRNLLCISPSTSGDVRSSREVDLATYACLECLGEGSTATCYLVEESETRQYFVAKVRLFGTPICVCLLVVLRTERKRFLNASSAPWAPTPSLTALLSAWQTCEPLLT